METLQQISTLLRERNRVDRQISEIIGRPATTGHIGEFIAAAVFDIELMSSASNKTIDGHFRTGTLANKSVDIKFYGKQEGLLAINEGAQPDYFLVLTGERAAAASSKKKSRLCTIEFVYLFDGRSLGDDLRARGVKFGVAASVRAVHWASAEVYPTQRCQTLVISDEQKRLLKMFQEARRIIFQPPR